MLEIRLEGVISVWILAAFSSQIWMKRLNARPLTLEVDDSGSAAACAASIAASTGSLVVMVTAAATPTSEKRLAAREFILAKSRLKSNSIHRRSIGDEGRVARCHVDLNVPCVNLHDPRPSQKERAIRPTARHDRVRPRNQLFAPPWPTCKATYGAHRFVRQV